MPIRKAPLPEEARKLFLQYPNRTLSYWAEEWGVSAERVRQIRLEANVGGVFDLDMSIVEHVANEIAKGNYVITSKELYQNLPVKYDGFRTWMLTHPEVQEKIKKAQFIAQNNKYNPEFKLCIICKIDKSVDEYTKNQKFLDGYNKVCKDCSSNLKPEKDKLGRKTCLGCKKDKSRKSFTSNKNFKDGLVPFCKGCKSKMRRAKRTLNTKVTDSI